MDDERGREEKGKRKGSGILRRNGIDISLYNSGKRTKKRGAGNKLRTCEVPPIYTHGYS